MVTPNSKPSASRNWRAFIFLELRAIKAKLDSCNKISCDITSFGVQLPKHGHGSAGMIMPQGMSHLVRVKWFQEKHRILHGNTKFASP